MTEPIKIEFNEESIQGESSWRIGRFTLPFNYIRDHLSVVHELMKDVVVLTSDYRPDLHAFEYVALGPSFERSPRGHAARTYEVVSRSEASGDGVRMVSLAFKPKHEEGVT
jgi:hypothetical protein